MGDFGAGFLWVVAEQCDSSVSVDFVHWRCALGERAVSVYAEEMLPFFLALACSPPKTHLLLVQGQDAPPGAQPIAGPSEPVDAWRTVLTGVTSSGESWPVVLPASMDADLRIQAPMRARAFQTPTRLTEHPSAALLFVPTTWPVEEGKGLHVLAPVPDLRGTPGTPTLYGPDFAAQVGLAHVGLFKEGDRYLGRVMGPKVPGTGTPRKDLNFEVRRSDRSVSFSLQEAPITVLEEAPAQWHKLSFALGDHHSAHAWVRFHAVEAFNELQLLMSPLHIDAGQPWTQMSWPAGWGAELAQAHGPFATALHPYPSAAVGEGRLSCAAFEEELLTLSGERARIAGAQDQQLVVLGSVAPQAWVDSGCAGDAGERSVAQAAAILKDSAGWRDRVVVVGVSPAWVQGLEVQDLADVLGALED